MIIHTLRLRLGLGVTVFQLPNLRAGVNLPRLLVELDDTGDDSDDCECHFTFLRLLPNDSFIPGNRGFLLLLRHLRFRLIPVPEGGCSRRLIHDCCPQRICTPPFPVLRTTSTCTHVYAIQAVISLIRGSTNTKTKILQPSDSVYTLITNYRCSYGGQYRCAGTLCACEGDETA